MNFFIVKFEKLINGGVKKAAGVLKNHEKNKRPPQFILNLRVALETEVTN